ncbi:hypothetical protein [Actinoplanes sp. HUAS TT8]|uniref:hypothetical protein n=1 Tax=Actinoplanes sp. HUAS TT8 TaxID=3447453 RepID=UPI003F523B51
MSADNHPPPPSADWELAGRRTVRFGVAYAVAAAAVVPLFTWATRNPGGGLALPLVLLLGNIVITALLLVGILGLLVSMVVWLVQTAKLQYGAPAGGHLGYWGIVAFTLLFVAAYLQPPALGTAGALLISSGERLLGVTLLIAGVTHTRRWIGRRTETHVPAESAVLLSSRPTAEDWSSEWDPDVDREIERRRSR